MPAPQGRPPFRRRQYIINRSFQFKFIAHMCAVAVVIIGAVYLSATYFFDGIVNQARSDGLPETHLFFKMIASFQAHLNWVFALTSSGIFVGLVAFGLLYSHRIAGPIYRLRKDLEAMADGSPLREIRFRKGDFFLEVPVAFNRLMRRLGVPEKAAAETKKAS